MVNSRVVRRASCVALLLLATGVLHAQEVIGIPVGETPPAVTVQNLNGDSVALSQDRTISSRLRSSRYVVVRVRLGPMDMELWRF